MVTAKNIPVESHEILLQFSCDDENLPQMLYFLWDELSIYSREVCFSGNLLNDRRSNGAL